MADQVTQSPERKTEASQAVRNLVRHASRLTELGADDNRRRWVVAERYFNHLEVSIETLEKEHHAMKSVSQLLVGQLADLIARVEALEGNNDDPTLIAETVPPGNGPTASAEGGEPLNREGYWSGLCTIVRELDRLVPAMETCELSPECRASLKRLIEFSAQMRVQVDGF